MTTIGEIIRATINYSVPNASEVQNVFHWVLAVENTTDSAILTEISRWAQDDWGSDWAELAADSAQLTSVKVDVVTALGTIVRAIGIGAIGLAGVQAGGVTSAAISAYMLLKTDLPKVRGSKYVPAVADVHVNEGSLNASGLIELAFLLIEYGSTLNPVGLAELIPGVSSSVLGVFQPFLDTGDIETIPAYQRRRKPNVGS